MTNKALNQKNKVKIYAYYLPQFHETKENNEWWGKGFTEWDNVRKAQKNFSDHNQPRIPLDNNYYDLSIKDNILWQANLARQYCIAGFNIYHYWHSGKQLLSLPIKILRENEDININYNLTWANHSWMRTWKNNDGYGEMLSKQEYESDPKEMEKHYKYLAYIMSDSRYTYVKDKLLFSIYRPYDIPNIGVYLDGLRAYIQKELNKEIYINSMIQYPPKDQQFLKYIDSISLFQPGTAMFHTDHLSNPRLTPENISILFKAKLINLNPTFRSFLYKLRNISSKNIKYKKINYIDMWQKILLQSKDNTYLGKQIISGAFADWDNTARYGNESTIFEAATPENFSVFMKELFKIVSNQNQSNLIFLNSWNEWGEGAYIEPDSKNKYKYLEAIQSLYDK
tara:strand:- start:725 stop:1912 length:1188 start_codon:yes stop_codon:yes gene_type:complete